jgi:predicted anti-sigma-YlaC factor YlaD
MFGCAKYRRLMNEKFDRGLEQREREFMAKHRAVCTECRREETQSANALNMLRMAAIEEDFDGGMVFEERVLRRWRVQSTRESVRYWSPAFAGAVIAGLTVLAALQIVTNRSTIPSTTNPAGEVRLERSGASLPTIDIDRIERLR